MDDAPEESWSEEEEERPPRPRRPRPLPPALPAGGDAPDDDVAGEEADQIPTRRQPASRRRLPEGPDPLDDPRAPIVLRRAPRGAPPHGTRRGTPPSVRRDPGRDYSYDEDAYDESAYDEEDYGDRRYDDEPYRRPSSAGSRRGSPSSRGYGGDPRRRDPYEEAGRVPSRGRPEDFDASGPGAHAYDDDDYDDRGGRGYPDRYDYDDWQRRAQAPPARRRYREQWDDWRDTAAQWLSASLPVPGQKGRRFPVVLLLVLVLLVVVAAAGLLLGPKLLARLSGSAAEYTPPQGTYTPGPTPPAQAGFKKFVSARSNYSIDYPQGWTVSSEQQTIQGQPDAIDLFTPSTAGTFDSLVVEQPAAANGTSDPTVIANEVAAAQQGGVTFTATSSIAIQVNIGGEYWLRRDYTVNGNGSTNHEAILAGHHEGRAYVIVLASAANTFAGDYASYFQPALRSFRFNS